MGPIWQFKALFWYLESLGYSDFPEKVKKVKEVKEFKGVLFSLRLHTAGFLGQIDYLFGARLDDTS